MKRSYGEIVQLVLGAAMGGVVGYGIMAFYDATSAPADITNGLAICLVVVAVPLVLLAHEMGHLVAGLLNGFEFQFLIIGPLRVERVRGRIRLRLNRSAALAGGLVSMIPRGVQDLRRRMAWLVAGGPMASLFLGGLLLAAFQAVPEVGPRAGAVRIALLGAAIGSLAVGLGTLIPARGAGLDTDGRQLVRLLGRHGSAQGAALSLVALARAGTPPAGWPEDIVATAVTLSDGSATEAMARQFAAAREVDRGEMAAAAAHIERSLELADGLRSMRSIVYHEAAYFFAIHGGDPVRARALLDGAGTSPFAGQADRLRAEAAVLVAEGRGVEGLDRLREARRAILDEEADPTGRADQELAAVERLALLDAGTRP